MGIWPFRAKADSLKKSGMLAGATDWHSHILPGVDDGFKEMEDSLKALDEMEKEGVRHLWLTPHIMEDCPNETDKLRARFEELKLAYDGNIQLHLAAENMLDNLFEDRLEAGDLLPLGEKGKHLLVETSYFNPPMNMTAILGRIKSKGYFPVLAHPERYRYMDEKDYMRLKDMGILFQANYFSLLGAYGKTAQKKLEWLLKRGMVDMVGSDLHKLRVFQNLIDQRPDSRKHLEIMKEVVSRSQSLA